MMRRKLDGVPPVVHNGTYIATGPSGHPSGTVTVKNNLIYGTSPELAFCRSHTWLFIRRQLLLKGYKIKKEKP